MHIRLLLWNWCFSYFRNEKILSIVKELSQSDSKASDKVKRNQLVGFEANAMMYTLSISNMLFRGDGKSNIFHEDFFSKEADAILKGLKDEDGNPIKPTIGFMNPPYGGEKNKTNPTKKEIQFIEKLLDTVSRYAVVIAPLSTFFDDEDIRSRIISKHTLKYVINMPKELFMPNRLKFPFRDRYTLKQHPNRRDRDFRCYQCTCSAQRTVQGNALQRLAVCLQRTKTRLG